MKQRKLIQKLYKACFDHDAEKQFELRKKEFAKILKHKAEGKTFTHKCSNFRFRGKCNFRRSLLLYATFIKGKNV